MSDRILNFRLTTFVQRVRQRNIMFSEVHKIFLGNYVLIYLWTEEFFSVEKSRPVPDKGLSILVS